MPAKPSYRDFRIRVTLRAKEEYVHEGAAGKLAVAVKEKAEEGRANERLSTLIASHFSVPQKNVRIIKGTRQPAKTVRVYFSSVPH